MAKPGAREIRVKLEVRRSDMDDIRIVRGHSGDKYSIERGFEIGFVEGEVSGLALEEAVLC